MSWVTVIWSMTAGACLMLGAVHLLVWCWNRALRANLWFVGAAFSVAVVALVERSLMNAQTPAEYLAWHRWGHAATFLAICAIIGFVQSYFGTGRRWLAWTVIALRALVVVLAFVPGPTFNYREVTALVPVALLGETVAVPVAVPSPWARLGESSTLLLVAFVVDAAIRLWRKGGARERRRALVVGSGMALFLMVCLTNAFLVHTGTVAAPYFISLAFLFILAAMGSELSRDILGAARTAEELRQMQDRFRLTVEASPNGVVLANAEGRIVLANERAVKMFGYERGELLGVGIEALVPERFRGAHRTYRSGFRAAPTARAMGAGREIFARRKDGSEFPVEIGITPVESAEGMLVLSIIVDITARRQAEAETRELRDELAHVTRVTTLSELSGSLAHELNQPLVIILSNAQAIEEVQRILKQHVRSR